MPLLDLPPEVFENVTHELVSVAGIDQAWKLREVCRTFKDAITYEIFAKQPMDALTGPGARIFNHNSGLYLYYRSKVLLDADPYLPNVVNDMVNSLAEHLDIDSDNKKETMRQGICDNLHWFCSFSKILSILRGGTSAVLAYPSITKIPLFGFFEKLVAALCLERHSLLLTLIQELIDFAVHPIFGAPLHDATVLGHEAAVEAILEGLSRAMGNEDETPRARTAVLVPSNGGFSITEAVHGAIRQDDESLLSILVEWYKGRGFTFSKAIYNMFLDTAFEHCSLETVRSILDIPYDKRGSPRKITWHHFQKACFDGRDDVVELFLDDGYIDANDQKFATSPLAEAVLEDHVQVVQAVVNAGADVQQEHSLRGKKVLPIMIAIKRENYSVVRYLLNAGSPLPQWKYDSCYEILRQAKMKAGGGKDLPEEFAQFRRLSRKEKGKL
ncbi:hypothetical protein J4E91_004515 [Alternaria rosae]|nr:hypothetical protein J4E91_004515 [Alternaria rosae]